MEGLGRPVMGGWIRTHGAGAIGVRKILQFHLGEVLDIGLRLGTLTDLCRRQGFGVRRVPGGQMSAERVAAGSTEWEPAPWKLVDKTCKRRFEADDARRTYPDQNGSL